MGKKEQDADIAARYISGHKAAADRSNRLLLGEVS